LAKISIKDYIIDKEEYQKVRGMGLPPNFTGKKALKAWWNCPSLNPNGFRTLVF
jgi:hypothetical protein